MAASWAASSRRITYLVAIAARIGESRIFKAKITNNCPLSFSWYMWWSLFLENIILWKFILLLEGGVGGHRKNKNKKLSDRVFVFRNDKIIDPGPASQRTLNDPVLSLAYSSWVTSLTVSKYSFQGKSKNTLNLIFQSQQGKPECYFLLGSKKQIREL